MQEVLMFLSLSLLVLSWILLWTGRYTDGKSNGIITGLMVLVLPALIILIISLII